jgi:hypothetical protein
MCITLLAACAAGASAGSIMGVIDDVVKVRDTKGNVVGVIEQLRLVPLNTQHKKEKVVAPQDDDAKKANISDAPSDILPGVPTPLDNDNFTVLPMPPRDPNETVVLPPPPMKDENGESRCVVLSSSHPMCSHCGKRAKKCSRDVTFFFRSLGHIAHREHLAAFGKTR